MEAEYVEGCAVAADDSETDPSFVLILRDPFLRHTGEICAVADAVHAREGSRLHGEDLLELTVIELGIESVVHIGSQRSVKHVVYLQSKYDGQGQKDDGECVLEDDENLAE